MLPLGTAVLATLQSPGTADTWAAVGAGLATVIVVADARKKDHSTWHLACVVVSSWFVGSTGPAVLMQLFAGPVQPILSWHAWSMAGFACGLSGWGMVRIFQRNMPAYLELLWQKIIAFLTPNQKP